MSKKSKKSRLDQILPQKRKSNKKKVIGVGLAGAVIAAIATAFAKESDRQ